MPDSPRTNQSETEPGGSELLGITAVVLTHKRPTLAGDVVRSLTEIEGLNPEQIIVVVNGEGGLDDPALESSVRMLRQSSNLGPAGGFLAGIVAAFESPSTRWAYLCEDDIGLLPLPLPRLADLLERIEASGNSKVGAVVAFGREFVGRGAHTENVVPPEGTLHDLALTDVATWGATLISREVYERGVLPDTRWYFGLEDFDFYCRIRSAGLDVLVDGRSARAVEAQQSSDGRDAALKDRRPIDQDEPWRAYYHARNSFTLIRRHGRPTWHAWHLAYSVRRLQLASSGAERLAIIHGLIDGIRGKLGEHPRYGRRVGERDPSSRSSTSST